MDPPVRKKKKTTTNLKPSPVSVQRSIWISETTTGYLTTIIPHASTTPYPKRSIYDSSAPTNSNFSSSSFAPSSASASYSAATTTTPQKTHSSGISDESGKNHLRNGYMFTSPSFVEGPSSWESPEIRDSMKARSRHIQRRIAGCLRRTCWSYGKVACSINRKVHFRCSSKSNGSILLKEQRAVPERGRLSCVTPAFAFRWLLFLLTLIPGGHLYIYSESFWRNSTCEGNLFISTSHHGHSGWWNFNFTRNMRWWSKRRKRSNHCH